MIIQAGPAHHLIQVTRLFALPLLEGVNYCLCDYTPPIHHHSDIHEGPLLYLGLASFP